MSHRAFASLHSALYRFLCVSVTFLSFAGLAHGQVQPGFPSFVPMECHEVDCVNLSNGNITLNVPVLSKAGAIPFNFSLGTNSYMSAVPEGTSFYWSSSMGGSAYGSPSGLGASPTQPSVGNATVTSTTCGGIPTYIASAFYVQDNQGTMHYLPPSDSAIESAQPGCTSSFTATTIDGSGITATITDGNFVSAYDRAGNQLFGIAYSAITDPNGNSVKIDCATGSCVWTDTLGLIAMTGSGSTYTWTSAGGGSPYVQPTTTGLTVKTVFGCTNISDINNSSESQLLTGLSFPDGTALSFGYETTPSNSPKVTGRIGSITLREGGSITYAYSGTNNGMNCTYQIPPTIQRTTSDGTTTYNFAPSSTGVTTTVTDNGGNVTIYNFVNSSTLTGDPAVGSPILTEIRHYQGSNTLLTTDVYCYNGASGQPSNCPTASSPFPITERDVYHTISGMSTSSRTQVKYDSYGDVTYSAAYDFGGTTPVHATTITYGTCTASCGTSTPTISAIGSNINNKPGEVVTTQNGSTIAQANYTYNSHGNLTSTSVWNGSSWLGQTSLNTYNSNGTLLKMFDLANHETDYSYLATSYTDCGSCTQFPFPTSIKDVSTGLATQATWEGYGAVETSSTDPSGNPTMYGYGSDPFSRVMSIEDPQENTVYKTYPTGSSPDTMNSSFTFNSGSSIQSTTLTTDGYGRNVNSQTLQSPTSTTYDTLSTSYAWSSNYHTAAVSQPCSATSGGSCSTVHTQYFDPLGRLYEETTLSNETVQHTYTQNDDLTVLEPAPSGENVKQVQRQFDGLGRLQYSCMIGNGSSSPCAQNTGGQNGVTDAYTYGQGTGYTTISVQRGGSSGQNRSVTYDAVGRVTQTKIPETGSGTWNYYYDSSSAISCPTGYAGATGQLKASKDPKGNLLCYSYDGLNRVTGVNANNGTICRHFYYDNSTGYSGTIPTGITIANPYGKMVEAATDSCSSGTLVTDEWFSYDSLGRQTDMWELTPHSLVNGTHVYYHV
jgi:YD repeat-containing protein